MPAYEKILPPRNDFASEKEKKEKVMNDKSKAIPPPHNYLWWGNKMGFFKKITFGTFRNFLAPFEIPNEILLFT